MEDQAINQCSSSSNNASEKGQESTLEINIKSLDSETYTFQVKKNETVSFLKEKIAGEIGVVFRGRVLKDDRPLSEYHLENGHTLHLVIGQPAESQPSSGTPPKGATASDGNWDCLSSAQSGESISKGEDAAGEAKLTKATPEVATDTPLGLGLGGLDRKKRSKQPKAVGKNDDSGASASLEGVQQSSENSVQNPLQSLFSGSSHSNETGVRCGQGSDDRVDVSSAMSKVLESPVLDGLLAGVSQQSGFDSPQILRNMLQQFTQNPQIMKRVQQIAKQVDVQEIENMMSSRAQGGGFDLCRMVQLMQPLVSGAFSQGGPSLEPATLHPSNDQQPFQCQSDKELGQDLGHPTHAKDILRTRGQSSALSGESTSNGEDAAGDARLTKATPEVATATPLGLGLGGLDRKKRSKQPKAEGKTDDSGTSASLEGVQQSSENSVQNPLQSLFSGSSHSNETGV